MYGGGVESVVMNYYRHIDRQKVQFDFIVDSDSTLVPRQEIESLGGRIFEIPPYQHQISYQKNLTKLFKKQKWKIIHSHINTLSVFPLYVAKKLNIPVRIAHCHSTSNKKDIKRNLLKQILKNWANVYPTHKFACSKFAGEWMFGKDSNFEIIYNAIDLDKFKYNDEMRHDLREKLKIPKDYFVVGHVGRFEIQKNHKFIVKMFNELLTRRPKSCLLLVGNGEKIDKIKKMVNDYGIAKNVIIISQSNNMQKIYSAFDVFILPSLFEGLPLVGIEAQVSGLECLFSNKITKEVDVTNTSKFLSITDMTNWVNTLNNYKIEEVKRSEIDTQNFYNYNILNQSKKLTTKYQELCKRFCNAN